MSVVAACEAPAALMAKAPKPLYMPVKVEADLHRIIHTISAHYGKDANVWLSELLRPILAEQHELMAKDILKFPHGRKRP